MPDTSTIGQRITQLLQQLGITKNAFAQSLGKTATVIQHLVDERNKPGYDLLCKIVEVYPNVSLQWIMLGEPPMLSQSTRPAHTEPAAPADNGIDLSEVPNVPRRRNGALLQPSDIAATLALAAHGPVKNGAAPAGEPSPAFAEHAASRPSSPAGFPAPPAATPATTQEPPALSQPPAITAPAPPIAVPAPSPDASYLAAALQSQYLQHQLALAEQRNQHLLEQQALLQQMVQLLQRAV